MAHRFMAKEQQHHQLKIHSALGPDALVPERLSVSEGMSQLYEIRLSFLANERLTDMQGQIGEEITLSLTLNQQANAEERFFHGHILTIGERGKPLHNSEGQRYDVIIVPRAWSATHRSNCRIFQDQTALAIIETVLEEHQVSLESQINSSLFNYGYCVQYNETDWQFVCRLLAQEGLSFFFRHEQGAHHMVVTDNIKAYDKAAEDQVIFCSRPTGECRISSWHTGFSATSNSLVEQGYDFHRPNDRIHDDSRGQVPGNGFGQRELFNYLGEDPALIENTQLADRHLQALTQDAETFQGESDYRSFSTGLTFSFGEHEDTLPDHNEFVITELTLDMALPTSLDDNSGNQSIRFSNRFKCMPTLSAYTPARLAKPVIPGVQTATVTGAAGEELHLDDHGRIKVQFHWDREGRHDQTSSCWIRVAQSWAGNGFGAQFLPRIGQEVLVEFINGDPDQPLITGAVYNARNPLPYATPGQKNSSGIRSRSTIGGGMANYNEVRFDDEKGQEKLVIHAEKDHELTIEHDQRDDIANNRQATIGNNDNLNIKGNQTVDITGNQSISSGKSITVEAGTNITLKTGGASITLESSGKIAIKGTQLDMNGTVISLKAGKINLN
ncbi:MAG: type VI secretion system tip protein VgrG [Halomonadaceae bacterium]|nr:MAG: type VI secretion system tip protein VgrG [Halomonadaceae bacterium]